MTSNQPPNHRTKSPTRVILQTSFLVFRRAIRRTALCTSFNELVSAYPESIRQRSHACVSQFLPLSLLLAWPFHFSWKHHSPAVTARQALPTLCPLSSPPPARRCTWTSNPPCPLHHTKSGTARTSLKRPSSVPPRIHHIRHHFQSVRVAPAPQQLNLCFRKRCFGMSTLVCFFSSPFLASPSLHLPCGVSFRRRLRICSRPLLFFLRHMAWMFVMKQGRQSQLKKKFRNVPINNELKRKNDSGRWRRQIIVLVLRDPYVKTERRLLSLCWRKQLHRVCHAFIGPLEHGRAT